MMLHAWKNYKLYAWGESELKPISRKATPFSGVPHLGTTIIDSLDTLYIMGLTKEYIEGRDWVAHHFTLNHAVN